MSNESNFGGYSSIFAQRLREIMSGTKTTQKDLAEALGISRQAVSQYSDGSTLPSIEKLHSIAKYFEVSCDWLLGGIECKKPENIAISKELGLSDEAIELLKGYTLTGDTDFLILINFIIEQETPCPEKVDYCFETYSSGMQFSSEEYSRDLEEWKSSCYIPILSSMRDFLSIKIDEDTLFNILTHSIKPEIKAQEGVYWLNNEPSLVKSGISGKALVDKYILSMISDLFQKTKDTKNPLPDYTKGR